MNERLMRMRIIWGALVTSHLVFVGVAVAVTRTMPDGVGADKGFPPVFGLVFVALGLTGVAVSLLLRNVLSGRAERAKDPSALRFQSMIIRLALTDFASTLGLVHALLTGGLTIALILFAAGFIAAIWHFPLEA